MADANIPACEEPLRDIIGLADCLLAASDGPASESCPDESRARVAMVIGNRAREVLRLLWPEG